MVVPALAPLPPRGAVSMARELVLEARKTSRSLTSSKWARRGEQGRLLL
jgi:hypothetical protein